MITYIIAAVSVWLATFALMLALTSASTLTTIVVANCVVVFMNVGAILVGGNR